MRRGLVSSDEEEGFPRYFWARQESVLIQGRLINQAQGWYKAYPVELTEVPQGVEALLAEQEWGHAI